MLDALRWVPTGLATWVFETDQSPGSVRLRENRVYVHEVAAKLIEEKRQELKDGTSRRDVLTLLGSSCIISMKFGIHYNFQPFSQGKFIPETRLAAQRRRNRCPSSVNGIFTSVQTGPSLLTRGAGRL